MILSSFKQKSQEAFSLIKSALLFPPKKKKKKPTTTTTTTLNYFQLKIK